jgi:hypothetical protein
MNSITKEEITLDRKQELYLVISSYANIDYFHSESSRNEILRELFKVLPKQTFLIQSLREASEICRKYIKQYDLGSSNFSGGYVYNLDNKFVAEISFNGKVWDKPYDFENWKSRNEII